MHVRVWIYFAVSAAALILATSLWPGVGVPTDPTRADTLDAVRGALLTWMGVLAYVGLVGAMYPASGLGDLVAVYASAAHVAMVAWTNAPALASLAPWNCRLAQPWYAPRIALVCGADDVPASDHDTSTWALERVSVGSTAALSLSAVYFCYDLLVCARAERRPGLRGAVMWGADLAHGLLGLVATGVLPLVLWRTHAPALWLLRIEFSTPVFLLRQLLAWDRRRRREHALPRPGFWQTCDRVVDWLFLGTFAIVRIVWQAAAVRWLVPMAVGWCKDADTTSSAAGVLAVALLTTTSALTAFWFLGLVAVTLADARPRLVAATLVATRPNRDPPE